MKDSSILSIILRSIFLVLFNVVFFVLGGFEHSPSVWISYGFIHLAYFKLILTSKLIRSGKSRAIFGFSLYTISTTYFIVAFIVGIAFILISPEGFRAALLVQLCIAGFFSLILISNMLANEHTAKSEEDRQYEIEYIKTASLRLKCLLGNINDKEVKKKIEKVYDAVYSSPVKSNTRLVQIENRILISIDELESGVSAWDKEKIIATSNSLLNMVNERNMQLKNLN